MRVILLVLGIAAVSMVGCGHRSMEPEEGVTLPSQVKGTDNGDDLSSFRMALRIPKVAIEHVARVEYVITAADIDTLRGELTIGADDVARGTVTGVKAGVDRLVTLNAYNAEGVMTYTGSSTVEVIAGDTVQVRIAMRSLVPTTGDIEIEGTFGGEEGVFPLPGGGTIEMVWIEPGTFVMGSPDSETGRDSNEGPQHQVTISRGFYLGRYELTQGQWESVMGTRPWSGQDYVQENASNPAVHISWEDVQALITKLNQAEGATAYRLPTEAEWEYAWYDANAWNAGEQYAHAVGTKLPNPWGLYDLHGNVWEWVQDWYGAYTSSPQTDPTGSATGSARVIRGGSFAGHAQNARSAGRDYGAPGGRGGPIGARLLRQGR